SLRQALKAAGRGMEMQVTNYRERVAAVDPVGGRGLADLKEIVQLVEDDLVKVEELFEVQCRSDVALVGEIARYMREGGGKRIRPALLLLASRTCGFRGERAIVLASV